MCEAGSCTMNSYVHAHQLYIKDTDSMCGNVAYDHDIVKLYDFIIRMGNLYLLSHERHIVNILTKTTLN